MIRARAMSLLREAEGRVLEELDRRFPRRKQVRFAIWLCALAIVGNLLSTVLWSPLLAVPLLNFLAVPNLVASAFILLYSIPALAYLLLAQKEPPSNASKRLFLPLNPMRNIRLCLATLRYSWFFLETAPQWAWCVARYVLWEQLLRKLGEHLGTAQKGQAADEERAVSTTIDLFEGFAAFGIEYAHPPGRSPALLDVYLPHPPVLTAVQRSLSARTASGSSHRPAPVPSSVPQATPTTAPDTDTTSPPHAAPPPRSSSPLSSNAPTPRMTPRKLPLDVSPPTAKFTLPGVSPPSTRKETKPLKPVVVFIYDVGMLGPIKPTRQMWMLLGTKLAEMGYGGSSVRWVGLRVVTVIPSITTYPDGRAEAMVRDVREALHWVDLHIHKYGGDASKIYVAGHGLGAHLALFTLAQEAVVLSRDDRAKSTTLEMKTRRVHTSAFGSPARPLSTPTATDVPNGLKILKIYASEVPIPHIRGVILMSPVADVIKQIRHESSLYLEHISTLRRALGPSQTGCMRNSLGHLLFAAKSVLQPHRLPPRILIMHGAQDKLVPLDGAHWLSELLYGLDIHTTFRPYKNLGHWELVKGLMKGMETEVSPWLEQDGESAVQDVGLTIVRTFIR